ncbi:MAG TPA: hypothetical protein VND45_06560 [Thermoanaerobaculia bacterium]|jgi:hypothetical protein|nr:hypothetical protein [Thermoanaerobaculia bacterium]
MNPWVCAALIAVAGAAGGVVNALLTSNGFILPRREQTILLPGFLSNVLIGAFAAFASWAFYGSGAAIDLAVSSGQSVTSLRFSALAGAFLVGVGGARWLSNETDKELLKETVKVAGEKQISRQDCEDIVRLPPREALAAAQRV